MSDFTFACPHCSQSLEAPEEMLGQTIQCPSCNGSIQLDQTGSQPQEQPPPPPQVPQPTAEVSQEKQQAGRISPDSPHGAVDEKLLATHLTDLQLTAGEELFFFQETINPAMDLGGFLNKPTYNLMISSQRILALAKDKTGKLSRTEFVLERLKGAEVGKAMGLDALQILVADPAEKGVEYVFSGRKAAWCTNEHLAVVAQFIKGTIQRSRPADNSSTSPQEPQEKGFFASFREALDDMPVQVNYLSGAYGLKPTTPCNLTIGKENLALIQLGLLGDKEVFRIPWSSVLGATVDVAERMTLTRIGLLGIFAFGFKKKDKLLELDFNDETGMKVSVVVGKGMGMTEMETLQGRILQARRDFLKSHGKSEPYEQPTSSTGGQALDVPTQIQKIADLHKQGILTTEEFERKKSELLARF